MALIKIDNNIFYTEDVMCITRIKACIYPRKTYYYFMIFFKNGKEIEISEDERNRYKLETERKELIDVLWGENDIFGET